MGYCGIKTQISSQHLHSAYREVKVPMYSVFGDLGRLTYRLEHPSASEPKCQKWRYASEQGDAN